MNIFEKIRAKIRSEPDKEDANSKKNPNYMYMDLPDFLRIQNEGYIRLDTHPDIKVCIKKIADLISSMPIHLMQNIEIGNRRITDGLSRKVDIDPNPYMTRKTLIYKCVEEMLLRGNSFLLPIYDQDGLLQELRPINSHSVSLNPLDDGGYIAKIDDVDFESDEIINLVNNPSLNNPWQGQSYRVTARDILKNINESNKIKSDFYTKHYRPGLIFMFSGDNDLFGTEENREKIFEKWVKAKPGMPYVLPGGMIDVKTFNNMSLSDIAINESVELDKRFIAALLGVPAFFIGIGEYDEQEYNNFIDTTIRPIAEIIQQEFTKKLLIADDRFFKFNIGSLKAFDTDSRLNCLYRGKAMGVFNADEIRIAAGYEPTNKPEMQEFTLLENFIKVEDTGKQGKLTGGDK